MPTVVGQFGSASAARQAMRELLDSGLADGPVRLSTPAAADGIGAEAPGQPYGNQPGQAYEEPGDIARSHPTCTLTVTAESDPESQRIERVLERHGGRVSTTP